MNATGLASSVEQTEMETARRWLDSILVKNTEEIKNGKCRHSHDEPFSFKCGEKSSRELFKDTKPQVKSGEVKGGRKTHSLLWRNSDYPIACEMEITEFTEFPAFEWVISLRNEGSEDTELISDFKALDIFWKRKQDDESTPVLLRSLGSNARPDDFKLCRDELKCDLWTPGRTLRMDHESNAAFRKIRDIRAHIDDYRPSSNWLPFFNLRTGADGIILAFGWSGEWFAEFAHDGQGKIDISAGMEHLSTKLLPGEEIRSLRILVFCWRGEEIHAQNIFRKFILRHHTPQENGKPAELPICNGTWGGRTTQEHLEIIGKITEHKLPYDCYWIDAGWYGTSTEPCPNVFKGNWWIVGDWRVNRNYHPDGLKPVSDAARKAGMKFLLWVEPESASYGVPVSIEHPEWFLRKDGCGTPKKHERLLLNLGNRDAWQWAVETVSELILENGIGIYREDFNIDPSPYWKHADTEGRCGITEMRFVEGFYAFWDELLKRHPGLLIDNCASGGRRLELETIGRSLALWRTDYNCFPSINPNATQSHGYGISRWLPCNSISPIAKPGDTYQFRSALSSGIIFNIDEFGLSDFKRADYPWKWHHEMLLQAKRVRPFFYGDFHPLTQGDWDSDSWFAYQMNRQEQGDGLIVAFRRENSPVNCMHFCLQGLQDEAEYSIEDADSGQKWKRSGTELMKNGLPLELSAPRTSKLLFYKKL